MASDKEHIRHCVLFAFQLKKNIVKVAGMIIVLLIKRLTMSDLQKLLQEISRERL